ncbi:hypothetical protein BGX28_004912 [Mortierella sp. GBA30]|nr:hypothetical protein BGX28_004912 [Mortierella sp. GBA30]
MSVQDHPQGQQRNSAPHPHRTLWQSYTTDTSPSVMSTRSCTPPSAAPPSTESTIFAGETATCSTPPHNSVTSLVSSLSGDYSAAMLARQAVPTAGGWADLSAMNISCDKGHESRACTMARPVPKVIHGRSKVSLVEQPHADSNTISDSPASPPPPAPAPQSSKSPISSPLPLASSFSSSTSHSSLNLPPRPISPSKRMSASTSFSSTLMAKPSSSFTTSAIPSQATGVPETGDALMDIESCIDNPVLAPLGRHVNKRRLPKRMDSDHIDINVVRPVSSSALIQEQEREAHTPVTSLILRRRRLDCEQLDRYLQNLQPTLDPQTMSILQSPLLHLTELDLSRNRLSALPAKLTTLVPSLTYLNLSHNQFTEIPLELCRLTRLQVLIMSQNRIEGPVPHQICSSLLQLKTLRLCANQITSLPHTLSRLDKLESLSMGSVYGGNLLTTFPVRCIQFMSALRELDLSHNKLCFLPADIGHPSSHLRQLVASDNKLEAIPKSIGMCQELRSLNLGRNQLTSLPTEIADLKQLDTLDLSENLLCVIPGDVADFLTKTTLLLTGNPFTRGYCDASRNPVSEIGGLGINYPSEEDRYAAVLKSLSRRAILNSAATSSSSSNHTPTLSSLAAGRESPRLTATSEHGYEMDQDERLDYHLYYTRHALSSRPPSRAESVGSMNENGATSDYGSAYGGTWADPYGSATGSSTPRVNAEAVISDIDSFFDCLPSLSSRTNTTSTTTVSISSSTITAEPSIFEGASLSVPSTPPSIFPILVTESEAPSDAAAESGEIYNVVTPHYHNSHGNESSISPVTSALNDVASSIPPPVTTSLNFFPSLLELAARAVLHRGQPLPIECMPEQVVDYLEPGARPCGLCRRPYVKEWVSSVRVKSYLGHPAVARRVRFCSAACWKTASEQLEAEEAAGTGRPGVMSPSVPSLTPGARTGHLPPVLTMESRRSSNTSQEDDIESALPSPVSQGMRVCKGGQTYWPVIGRKMRHNRGRSSSTSDSSSSSSSLSSPITHTVDETGSITKSTSTSHRETNVCSGGCLGGGVCEW